jgi:hypothetical protein
MRKDDRIRLRHMLDAAREAIEFAQNSRRQDLDSDRKLTLALVKDVEIMAKPPIKSRKIRGAPCRKFPGRILSACAIVWSMPTLTLTWTSFGKLCKQTSPRLRKFFPRH